MRTLVTAAQVAAVLLLSQSLHATDHSDPQAIAGRYCSGDGLTWIFNLKVAAKGYELSWLWEFCTSSTEPRDTCNGYFFVRTLDGSRPAGAATRGRPRVCSESGNR